MNKRKSIAFTTCRPQRIPWTVICAIVFCGLHEARQSSR